MLQAVGREVPHRCRAPGHHRRGPAGLHRLVGAVLVEQNDEWIESRRYMGPELLAKTGSHPIEGQISNSTLSAELTA